MEKTTSGGHQSQGFSSPRTKDAARSTRTPVASSRPMIRTSESKLDSGWQMYVRYGLSAVMHVACLGYIVYMMHAGGVLDIVKSYYDAKMPWVHQCGLMQSKEYIILSERIVGSRGIVAGGIHVRGGMIAGTFLGRGGMNESYVVKNLVGSKKIDVFNYGDSVVGPGFIDVHVHMNDPGRPEWETMHQATQAAAAGGVTMVVDMPLNSVPVTTTKSRLKEKIRIGASSSYVQVGFWGGLVPENAYRPRVLRGLVNAGAFGFKAFMAPSGIDDFEKVSIDDIQAALPYIRDLDVPLLVHAEVVDSETTNSIPTEGNPAQYASWMNARPAAMEIKAVKQLIHALEGLDTKEKKYFRVHVVHIADAEALALIADAKKRKLPISVETCPHYLMFSSDMVPDGATEYKCAPPIRDATNRDALRRAVLNRDIDGVSSDHSPSPASMKNSGDFMKSWGGISGLQYSLPALWQSLLAKQADVSPAVVHRVLSEFPASLLGLGHLKGKIRDGYHADLAIWSPDQESDTSERSCHQSQKLTPYIGANMKGKVLATIVRGSMVFDASVGVSAKACSSSLTRRSLRKEK